jgi:hypothetical protein
LGRFFAGRDFRGTGGPQKTPRSLAGAQGRGDLVFPSGAVKPAAYPLPGRVRRQPLVTGIAARLSGRGRFQRLREQQMESIKMVWIRSRMSQFSEHLGNSRRFSQPLQGLLTRYPISKSNLCLEKGLWVNDFMGFFASTIWVRPCPEWGKSRTPFFLTERF